MNKTLVCVLAAAMLVQVARAVGQPVTVLPEETNEILANPGMGWETFHHTSKQDKNLPSWIPSTVHYARWGWGELEPQPGKLNTEFLDKVLKETRESGQKLAFRVMCCSTYKGRPYHPKWLKEIGGKELQADYEGKARSRFPTWTIPSSWNAHLDFIKRLGERYDGHPDIDHVDLGSIGWWGEWHLSGSKKCKLPTLENRMKVVDAYLAAFKKTPLLMLIGGGECLKYACAHGAGWRADCLGDMGGFSRTWCHMRQGYPVWIKEAGIQDAWKTAPVAWETCWDMRKWVNEGWSLRYIFNYALACHASYINNKSAPLPAGRRRSARGGAVPAAAGLSPGAEGTEASGPGQGGRQAGTGDEVAEHRLGPVLPAVSPGLSADATRTATARSSSATSTVNRWLPGSIDLFTDEFFKKPKDLPPGEVVDVADSHHAARRHARRAVHACPSPWSDEDVEARRAAGHQRPGRRRLVSAEQADGQVVTPPSPLRPPWPAVPLA